MIDSPYNVIGFEGTVDSACGTSFAIAEVPGEEGQYFRLIPPGWADESGATPETESFDRATFDSLVESGLASSLRRPLVGIRGDVVLSLRKDLRETIETEGLSEPPGASRLVWADVNHPTSTHLQGLAACLDGEAALSLMEEYARLLVRIASTSLLEATAQRSHPVQGMAHGELPERAERVAWMALDAAQYDQTRLLVFLRLGAAISLSSSPERVDSIYDLVISHESLANGWSTPLEFRVAVQSLLGQFAFATSGLRPAALLSLGEAGADKALESGNHDFSPSPLEHDSARELLLQKAYAFQHLQQSDTREAGGSASYPVRSQLAESHGLLASPEDAISLRQQILSTAGLDIDNLALLLALASSPSFWFAGLLEIVEGQRHRQVLFHTIPFQRRLNADASEDSEANRVLTGR